MAIRERGMEGKTACILSAVSHKDMFAPPPLSPHPPPPPPDAIRGAAGLPAPPPPALTPPPPHIIWDRLSEVEDGL
jgi:hypothetical protein